MNTSLGGAAAAAAADQSFRPWGASAGAATFCRPAKTPPLTACCRWWPGVSSGVWRHAVLWSKSRCASLGVTGRRISEVSCSSSSSSSNGGGNGTRGLTYKDAGVDIDAGAELVRRIAKMAPGIGGFGGLFPLGDSYLVAGTDGVGTKLKLAFDTGIHNTIGIDLVAMSVNDIVTSGAKPLFFLDYFATSHLDVDIAEQVIKGIVDGCQQSDCVLLGGETAEMPDFYAKGEYDLSGFAVGIVKKDSVIDGKNIEEGDALIGLPSSGVHSNGFSLVRRVLAQSGCSLNDQLIVSSGKPVTLEALESLNTKTIDPVMASDGEVCGVGPCARKGSIREINGLGDDTRSPEPASLDLNGRELCDPANGDQEGGGGGYGGCGGEEDALAFFSSLSEDFFLDTPVSRLPAITEGAAGPEKGNAVTLALPAPPPMSDGLSAAMEQVEVAFQGEDPAALECGGLSKGEVMDVLSKVENFMETQASDTAKLIGVSDVGVDKGLKSSLLLIKRRWLADIARKAKCDVANKTGTSKN